MFQNWRSRRRQNKVKPGDGHALVPFRWWHLLYRSLFFLRLPGHIYAVSFNYFDMDSKAHLYRDGAHHAVSTLPAAFPVPGGEIQVAASTVGLKRMHYVTEACEVQQLTPDADSSEGRRARLETNRPTVSRWLGIVSAVVLVIALVLGLPQILELVTHWDVIAERVGTFTSPFHLPASLNTALTLAAVTASYERALRLRYNWLLDGGGDVDFDL